MVICKIRIALHDAINMEMKRTKEIKIEIEESDVIVMIFAHSYFHEYES